MMKKLTLILLALLIMSTQSFGQVVIKDSESWQKAEQGAIKVCTNDPHCRGMLKLCDDGVTVSVNDTCPSSDHIVYNHGKEGLVPRWGAIAIDISPNHKSYGYSASLKSQENANRLSMQLCKSKSSTCRVVSEFKNACSAVAYADGQGGDWIWTVGTHANADEAEKLALSNCYDKRKQGKYGKCDLAVYARCAAH